MTTPSSPSTPRPKLSEYVRKGAQPEVPAAQAAPQPATPATAAESEKDLDGVEVPPEAAQQEQETKSRLSLYEDMSQQLLPVKDYRAYLKEQKIEEDQAAAIVDDLLTKGYHEEEYALTKRTSVVFRTREHLDTLRLHAALQAQQPLYDNVANEIVIRYNLAASLAAFRGATEKQFEFPQSDDDEKAAGTLFDVRMRYLERMPAVLFAKLSVKLSEFDRLILSVMREGVAEHF